MSALSNYFLKYPVQNSVSYYNGGSDTLPVTKNEGTNKEATTGVNDQTISICMKCGKDYSNIEVQLYKVIACYCITARSQHDDQSKIRVVNHEIHRLRPLAGII